MKTVLFAVSWHVVLTMSASGTSMSYPDSEYSAISVVAKAYSDFRMLNGREPSSWEDINSLFKKPLNELHQRIQPTSRYIFLEPTIRNPETGDRIVIISRSPFPDESALRGSLGSLSGLQPSNFRRYLVVVTDEGAVRTNLVKEHELQKLFRDIRHPLPEGDPLGMRPYERDNLVKLGFWAVASFSTISFLILESFRRVKRR